MSTHEVDLTTTSATFTPERSKGAEAKADFSRFRLPTLIIILLACILGFIKVLPNDPVLDRRLVAIFIPNPPNPQERMLKEYLAKDPPLGTILPVPANMPLINGTGKLEIRPGPILIVMLQGCAPCSVGTLKDTERLQEKYPKWNIIAVSEAAPSDIRYFATRNKLHLPIIADSSHQMVNRYNALWTPRAYVVSYSGALLWAQRTWQFEVQQATYAMSIYNHGASK